MGMCDVCFNPWNMWYGLFSIAKQLGLLFHSPTEWKVVKFHGSSHHQPDKSLLIPRKSLKKIPRKFPWMFQSPPTNLPSEMTRGKKPLLHRLHGPPLLQPSRDFGNAVPQGGARQGFFPWKMANFMGQSGQEMRIWALKNGKVIYFYWRFFEKPKSAGNLSMIWNGLSGNLWFGMVLGELLWPQDWMGVSGVNFPSSMLKNHEGKSCIHKDIIEIEPLW